MKKTFDAVRLRAQYPCLRREIEGKRPVYLDSACTALKPRRVAEGMRDFYLNRGGCGGKRSANLFSRGVEALAVQARQEVADFIGAGSADEIVFTSGTTEAANLLAHAFPYRGRRREVVLTDLEHNSILLPFCEAARRGDVVLRICPTREGRLDLDRLAGMVSARTALVAMTRSSNVFGGALPAAEAARIAHRQGACLFVDDAQYLSSHREDVRAADVDFAAFSAHKLGGPFGVGVLYGKRRLLNRLGRYKVGGGTVRSVGWDGKLPLPDYLGAPAGLEAGVPNFGGIVGLMEAVRFLRDIPEDGLRRHIAGLAARAAEGLSRRPAVEVLGRPEDLRQGAIVSFKPAHAGFSPIDFNLYLNHELRGHFIAVRVGEHCAHLAHRGLGAPATVRLSFFAYSLASEVDLFLDALDGYLSSVRRGRA
ncbi:MAG TPA: cysteine desulfurase [Elusimicrobia bacterium]|nr:cysteine desulfurase [Elusimicrobiota bacterium]HBT62960.1 cysteine desulfurase [Elusimicrobiota bacterium]